MRRILLSALAAAGFATSAAGPAAAQPDDWDVKRDPFDKSAIAKYKAILARNPHDAGALARLLDQYRRFRSVDLLHAEYEKALDKKPDDFALLVVLARLDRATGDDAKALIRFQAAAKVKAGDAAVWIEIGTLDRNTGKLAEARTAFDAALEHAGDKQLKMKALRALADLALSASDVDGARRYFEQYIALEPKNVQLRLELGDALLAAGKHADAIEAYQDADKLLGTDPAKRVEVIARIGQALEGKGDTAGAVTEYRRAIKLVPKGYYLENELTTRIIQIYRERDELDTLLTHYEKEWPVGSRRYFEWDTLARLYEERGHQDKAIAAYQKAVGLSPWELETQRRLIQLLENVGRDDDALKQYESVVREAPGEARFQIDLAERYWRRGDAKKALDTLKKLEQRFPGDAGILSASADLYIRWNKEDLALDAYVRLTKLEPDDPAHLVTLGEQYFQRGNKDKAVDTWKRIAAGKNPSAAAEARLGEVLNEHGYPTEALTHYAIAIRKEPSNPELYKGRAVVYEGQKDYPNSVTDWETVLRLLPATDRGKRREAQRRLVQILIRWGAKDEKYKQDWQRAFRKTPPEVEAGYFLVEYYTKKPIENEPRTTLVRLHELVPTDQDTTLDLVKAYRAGRKYKEAVDLLVELAKLAPGRERELYTMISEIKSDERCATCDKEAIDWAKLALAKTPNDASGYEKLAERYHGMQKYAEAMAAYEKTLALDARNWKAYFALAQLYKESSQPIKAAELYRKVLRTASDDDVIERAAKAAIDIEEMNGTLGELEKVMAPMSFMMSHKSIYRRKLVELYVRYLLRQIEREQHGTPEVRKAARLELDRIGAHGLKPLLEALHDDKDLAQQKVAVQVLGHLGNKGAAAPLIKLAITEPKLDTGGVRRQQIGTLTPTPEWQVRVDALVAAGRLGDPGVIDQVQGGKLATHEEVAMREAAVFTLGRTGDRRALAPLVTALADSRDSVQAMACLGLAQIDDAKAVAALVQTVGEARRHDHVRSACAYGLGVRRAKSAVTALAAVLRDNHGETQRLAGWALGQIGESASTGALLRAYFGRRDGERGELAWAIARTAGGQPSPTVLASPASYPIKGGNPLVSGKLDLSAAIAELPGTVPAVTLPAAVISAHVDDIVAGVGDALGEHRDVVLGALSDLDARSDGVGLAGLVGDGPVDDKTRLALAKVGAGVAPFVSAHLDDSDAKVRALALSVLAKLDAKGVDEAIGKALADKTKWVRQAAMRAAVTVGTRRLASARTLAPALARALTDLSADTGADAWEDRRAAADALGALGGLELDALSRAVKDPKSYVREAVAGALGASTAPGAVEPLLILAKDDIPQVRAAAERALAKVRAAPKP